MNSLPKTVRSTRQRRGCDLNPGPSALESSTLTTRLPSHPKPKLIVELEYQCCVDWAYLLGGAYRVDEDDAGGAA